MTAPLPVDHARRLILAGSVNFITIGMAQSVLGPSLEAIGNDFAVPAATVSLAISVLFLGAGAAILMAGWLVRRFGYRLTLAGALVVLGGGAVLMTLAPNWPVALLAAALVGLGFGLQNVSTNLLIVRSFGVRAGPAVNLLSALFGIGSVLGPLLVGLLLPHWRVPYLILAGAALVALLVGLRIPEPEPETRSSHPLNPAIILSVLGFVSIFFFYVAAEMGAASWEATHLAPYFGPEQAAFLTSLYWAAITVGRFIAIPVSARVKPAHLVTGAAVLAIPGAVLTTIPSLAPYGYLIMGLAFAPIFPTTLVWIQQALPGRSELMIPITMSFANLGPVLTAPLIGFGVESYGTDFIPWALLTFTVLLLVTVMLQLPRTRS